MDSFGTTNGNRLQNAPGRSLPLSKRPYFEGHTTSTTEEGFEEEPNQNETTITTMAITNGDNQVVEPNHNHEDEIKQLNDKEQELLKEMDETNLKEQKLQTQLMDIHRKKYRLSKKLETVQHKKRAILLLQQKKQEKLRLTTSTTNDHATDPSSWSNDAADSEQATPENSNKRQKTDKFGNGQTQLAQQMKDITTKSYYEKAIQLVLQGHLWDIPPPSEIEHRRLAIFNWLPSHLIDKKDGTWKPNCPMCGDETCKHGNNNPPRFIYGPNNENYILNAPERYVCKRCAKEQKQLKEKSSETNKRRRIKKYTFNTSDDQILQQIRQHYPNIGALFPVFLTHRGGIDTNLLRALDKSRQVGEDKRRPMPYTSQQVRYFYLKWKETCANNEQNQAITTQEEEDNNTIDDNHLPQLPKDGNNLTHIF